MQPRRLPALLDGPGDRLVDVYQLERLHQVIESAHPDQPFRVLFIAYAGDDDDGRLGPALPDVAEQLQPAHARHGDVRQHQVEGLRIQEAQGLFSRPRRRALIRFGK